MAALRLLGVLNQTETVLEQEDKKLEMLGQRSYLCRPAPEPQSPLPATCLSLSSQSHCGYLELGAPAGQVLSHKLGLLSC